MQVTPKNQSTVSTTRATQQNSIVAWFEVLDVKKTDGNVECVEVSAKGGDVRNVNASNAHEALKTTVTDQQTGQSKDIFAAASKDASGTYIMKLKADLILQNNKGETTSYELSDCKIIADPKDVGVSGCASWTGSQGVCLVVSLDKDQSGKLTTEYGFYGDEIDTGLIKKDLNHDGIDETIWLHEDGSMDIRCYPSKA